MMVENWVIKGRLHQNWGIYEVSDDLSVCVLNLPP